MRTAPPIPRSAPPSPARAPRSGSRPREDGLNTLLYLVVPALGAVIDVYLLTQLDAKALLLGASWLTAGIVYLAVLTRGFRRPPPEMTSLEE